MIDFATREGNAPTMDSDYKQRRKMPFFNPAYQMVEEPMYTPDGECYIRGPKNEHAWFDKALRKWVEFDKDKTADMLRYAASRIKVPQEEVEALIAKFPNRVWTKYDCDSLVTGWWHYDDPMAFMVYHCQCEPDGRYKGKKTDPISAEEFDELWNRTERKCKF